ncbi:Hint domain-containing protein [Paenibacillus dendritiformis]|uniref:Hint domain-containing protein n=1 Tax=Paenibacillus dendritiformis TaxID=130049 RepID=UPI003145248C
MYGRQHSVTNQERSIRLNFCKFFILSLTSLPLASAQSIANCNLHCFSAGTPVQTKAGFKPIEEIRIGDFVLTKDERTGKTGYNTVVELFKRQAYETYRITVKGITITTGSIVMV